jgi:hypothetical protein
MHKHPDERAAPLRLRDRILSALELAIEQDDILIAENLLRILELSMTRNAGGGTFVEKRSFSPQILHAIEALEEKKKRQK